MTAIQSRVSEICPICKSHGTREFQICSKKQMNSKKEKHVELESNSAIHIFQTLDFGF